MTLVLYSERYDHFITLTRYEIGVDILYHWPPLATEGLMLACDRYQLEVLLADGWDVVGEL